VIFVKRIPVAIRKRNQGAKKDHLPLPFGVIT
jgi:hypothetical protein